MKRGKIPPEFLQKIKDAVSIVDIVGEHVVLRKAGTNHVGLCPFHSERSPSFSVSESKHLYHCYGCKKGGDLFSFMMEIHGISFPEAIEELADRAKLVLPQDFTGTADNPEAEKRRRAAQEKASTISRLNRFVAAFYHQNLAKHTAALQYLKNRGVSDELIREFYVGVASPGWDSLAHHLIAKKAPLNLASELGLIRPSPPQKKTVNGPGYFDLFRNRVMFPILNMRGKVAGFGGRTLPGGNDEGPKYMNSTESFSFQKSKLIFGLYQAQKHIREKDEVILVEGYFDVLGLVAAGFQNVVATCGTSLTQEHLHILKRFTNRLVILFDGDKAGVAATERAMELGLEQGWVLYGAMMPEGMDPDEILFNQTNGMPTPEGKARMVQILEQATPLIDDRIEQAIAEAGQGPEAKTQSLKKIAAWMAQYNDPVGKEVRMQNVVKRLGVQKALLTGPAGRQIPSKNQPLKPPQQPAPSRVRAVPLSQSDRILLGALARGGSFSELFGQARINLPPNQALSDLFEHPSAQGFASELFLDPLQLEKLRKSPDEILGPELDAQVRSTVTEALVQAEGSASLNDVKRVLDRSLGRLWARFSQRIKEAIGRAEASKDAGLHSELLKEYLDVQRKMKEFICFYDEA